MVQVDTQDGPTIAWVEISGWVLAKYIRYGSASLFTWWEIYERNLFLVLLDSPVLILTGFVATPGGYQNDLTMYHKKPTFNGIVFL